MGLPSLAEFEADARRAGLDEVLQRDWLPGYTMGTHAHDYAVNALVVRGELWVTADGRTQHCQVGERFALDPGVPHTEGAGPSGASFWVAKRAVPAD